jgi:hypothetical protein
MNLTRLIINASNYLLPNRGRPHMDHATADPTSDFFNTLLDLIGPYAKPNLSDRLQRRTPKMAAHQVENDFKEDW